MDVRRFLDEEKEKHNIGSDEQFAHFIGASKFALDKWLLRNILPDKWKMIIRQMSVQDMSNLIKIPKLSITASAGKGNDLEGIEAFEENGRLIIDSTTLNSSNYKNLRAIQVNGYSMIPMILPESWVIFKDGGAYEGEGLYVLNWDNTLMVKLVQITPFGEIRIVSANKDYESFTVEKNSQVIFKIIGKVVSTVQKIII
jgi:phage repressor protein C with HTH and peptisase S24 domain